MKPINIIRLLIFAAVFITANYAFAPKGNPNDNIKDMPEQRALQRFFTNRMAAQKPQVILLGNSMLGFGVNEKAFQALTGKRTVKFWTSGGASAWWYLTMKNVICKVETKPETVIIFFRDQYLTDPTFRVDARSRPHMDDMCDGKEPLLQKIAYARKMNPVSYFLHQHLPLYSKKDRVRPAIHTFIRNKSTAALLNTPKGDAQKAIARVFNNENMNQDLLTIRQLNAEKVRGKGKFDFHRRIEHSFLPHIIETAKAHDINLVFVRVKMRRDIEPDQEPEKVKEYIAHLAAYLEEQNCSFQDYTHDPRLKLEHYADGDHLNPEKGVRIFTEILSRQTVPLLSKKERSNTAG